MRRKVFLVAALFLSLIVVLFGIQHTLSFTAQVDPTSVIGSPFIFNSEDGEDKVIVIAKMASEHVDWVMTDLPDWQHAIYHMDDPSYILHVPENKGREAQAYLTFLIDHYHNLPDIILFLHPHLAGWPEAWHTDASDYSNVQSVQSLRLDYVREHGYANMRCIHIPGCPDEIQPLRNESSYPIDTAFRHAWTYFFDASVTAVPERVGAPCCSQFAVSRAQVLKRPLAEYLRYRKWLLEAEIGSDVSGRVMEYMWHILFGKDPVWCPSLETCYCQQFDRC